MMEVMLETPGGILSCFKILVEKQYLLIFWPMMFFAFLNGDYRE